MYTMKSCIALSKIICAIKIKKLVTLVFFIVQMALNFIWTTVFFRMKMMKMSLILIYAIIALTIVAVMKMLPVNKIAAGLLLPYLLWVLFASYLNLYIVVKN